MISKLREEYLEDLVKEICGLNEEEAEYLSKRIQEENLKLIDETLKAFDRRRNAAP